MILWKWFSEFKIKKKELLAAIWIMGWQLIWYSKKKNYRQMKHEKSDKIKVKYKVDTKQYGEDKIAWKYFQTSKIWLAANDLRLYQLK